MKKITTISAILIAGFLNTIALAESGNLSEQASAIKEAHKSLFDAAAVARKKVAGQTFEEFKAQVYREPGPIGKFIVNGDMAIANEKLLREFFDRMRAIPDNAEQANEPELAVLRVGGLDAVWSSSEKRNLTYCISTSFGANYAKMAAAMEQAAEAWENVADLDFLHLSAQDLACNENNPKVVFDIRPVFGQRYLARAFFPSDGRRHRNILVNDSSFALDPNGRLSLVGIMRHELGHTLGFRHEHTRPDSGTCFEDQNWRPLTNYDAFSTMHYPQCNGQGDWSLRLTELDKHGAACLYGAAAGFDHDPTKCLDFGSTGNGPVTVEYEAISISEGAEWRPDEPLRVSGRTRFVATMIGQGINPGDPDLYLKFDALANQGTFDCRPYDTGAVEECIVDVPEEAGLASIMVRGRSESSFSLIVSYVPAQE